MAQHERRLLTQRLGHNIDPGLGTEGYRAAVEDSHIPGFAPAGYLLCLVTCTAVLDAVTGDLGAEAARSRHRHSNSAVGHVRSWAHCLEEGQNTAVLVLKVANRHCDAM